jgi:hypothetical protein
MMKTMALFVVLLSFATLVKAEPKAHPDTTGWEVLFAGDLSDAEPTDGVWSVKDGVLTATKDETIWTKKDYENFSIDLEFKTADGSNSGVFVYGDLNDPIPNSIEVQILDDHSPNWAKEPARNRCGGIYGRLAATKSMVKKPGEWNHMTIECQGKNITVTLNGELVTKFDMSKWTSATKNPDGTDIPPWLSKPASEIATKGRIGLQGKHAGKPIYFRNVKVKKN